MDERTQMIEGATCPVCGGGNAPTAVWCADCGFRLDAAPGEVTEATPGYALLGGDAPLPLKRGTNVVGRLQADVFLSDPSISRRHAVIVVSDDGVTVKDEGSSNGTKVAGVLVPAGEERGLLPGQSVQFGTLVFQLSAPDGTPPERPAPDDIVEGPVLGQLEGDLGTFDLKEGANSIGRRPGNDVVISDPYVSGFHAVLTVSRDGAVLVDSGSSNGTFTGDRRLSAGDEEPLKAGQEITFGRSAFRFISVEADEVPPEEAETDASGA